MSSDDVDAINTYITSTATKTPEAGNLQSQWKTWYGNLNFITKGMDSTFTEASTRRTLFNAANQDPEDLTNAADLKPGEAVAKQAAIAQSTALSPQQKATAIAHNPNVATTKGVPGSAASHATIRQGSSGSDVTAWQNIIGVTADGKFGAGTASATKTWQTKHGLTADGVVGPKSWSAALGTPVQEAPSTNFNTSANKPYAGPAGAVLALPTTPTFTTVARVGLPIVGVVAGGLLGGPIAAVIGGALGLFGSSKV